MGRLIVAKIDKNLRLVIPVDVDSAVYHIHAEAISRETFERYFLVLSKTFAAIYNEGLGVTAGPRVAALMLKKVAEETGTWDGPAGVSNGLMAEIRRLCNVAVPGPNGGWETVPFQEAIDRDIFEPEDVSEVENGIVFFIVASATHRRDERKDILEGAAKLWGGHITSSSYTDFLASLKTSTPVDNSGANRVSSLPS